MGFVQDSVSLSHQWFSLPLSSSLSKKQQQKCFPQTLSMVPAFMHAGVCTINLQRSHAWPPGETVLPPATLPFTCFVLHSICHYPQVCYILICLFIVYPPTRRQTSTSWPHPSLHHVVIELMLLLLLPLPLGSFQDRSRPGILGLYRGWNLSPKSPASTPHC